VRDASLTAPARKACGAKRRNRAAHA